MKKKSIDHTKLLVLSLLSGEDMYGYQLIVELGRRSNRTFEMKEGTLYPVLHGLEKDGYVEAYQQEAPTGRVRKYYHLTRKGGAALKTEEKAWETYSGAVNAVLRSSAGLNLAGYGQAEPCGAGSGEPAAGDARRAGGHPGRDRRTYRGSHL